MPPASSPPTPPPEPPKPEAPVQGTDDSQETVAKRLADYERVSRLTTLCAAGLAAEVTLVASIGAGSSTIVALFVTLFFLSAIGLSLARGASDHQIDVLKRMMAERKICRRCTMKEAKAQDSPRNYLFEDWPKSLDFYYKSGVFLLISAGIVVWGHAITIALCDNDVVREHRQLLCAAKAKGTESPPPVLTATPTPTQTLTPHASPTPSPAAICKATVFKWGHVLLRSWPADPVIEVFQPGLDDVG